MPNHKRPNTSSQTKKPTMPNMQGMKGGAKQVQKTAEKTMKTATKTAKRTIKKVGKKGGATVMMGSAAGAVVGATLGGIAGAALSDQKTRRVVGEKIAEFAQNASQSMKAMSDKADDIKQSAIDVVDTTKRIEKRVTDK